MFQLGTKSKQRLQGVHPDLARVVHRAIQLTTQDFTVLEGVRSIETQRDYVRRGASQTMDSRHLVGPQGFGRAVDLVPWAGGMARWEWPLIYPIAEAVRQAAVELDIPIRWGGAWVSLNTMSPGGAKRAVDAYVAARKAAKKSAFLDGPHYELPKSARYP